MMISFYISDFWLGVIVTLVIEFVLLIVYAYQANWKK